MLPARQLALDLGHEESFARDDFLSGPANADALAAIERWPDWPSPVLALVGPRGSGKSHLAAIWAETAGARFLSGRGLQTATVPGALATGALVVEDLAAGGFDERALFHLFNLVREEQAYILLTAEQPPTLWNAALPDLVSRLRTVPAVTLGAPDDAMLRAVLVKLFADRQLQVDAPLLDFLLPRMERSLAGAKEAVARLDAEALRLRRPMTRALAAEVFRAEQLQMFD